MDSVRGANGFRNHPRWWNASNVDPSSPQRSPQAQTNTSFPFEHLAEVKTNVRILFHILSTLNPKSRFGGEPEGGGAELKKAPSKHLKFLGNKSCWRPQIKCLLSLRLAGFLISPLPTSPQKKARGKLAQKVMDKPHRTDPTWAK